MRQMIIQIALNIDTSATNWLNLIFIHIIKDAKLWTCSRFLLNFKNCRASSITIYFKLWSQYYKKKNKNQRQAHHVRGGWKVLKREREKVKDKPIVFGSSALTFTQCTKINHFTQNTLLISWAFWFSLFLVS